MEKISEAQQSLEVRLNNWKVDLIGQALCEAHGNKFEDGLKCVDISS